MSAPWTIQLCIHDPLNTDGCSCDPGQEFEDDSCPGRTKDCCCDNCFYGRDALARALVGLATETKELRERAAHDKAQAPKFYLLLLATERAKKALDTAYEKIIAAERNNARFPKTVTKKAIGRACCEFATAMELANANPQSKDGA